MASLKKVFSKGLLIAFLSCMLGFCQAAAVEAANLQKNSTGTQVVQLQKQLQALGYKIKEINGVFDNSTYRAVITFQRDHKLKINGIVDKKTAKAISEAKPLQGAKNVTPAGNGKSQNGSLRQGAAGLPAGAGVKAPETKPFLPRHKVQPLIKTAKKYIGVPYQFGGATPKAFDCSGYLQYVFSQHGISLPRTADLQYKLGKNTTMNKLEAGDLVFFSTYEAGASHCGIYLGQGQFIHASSSKGVRIDNIRDAYWLSKLYGCKHIVI